MTELLRKAGSGSVPGPEFNDVVDALGGSRPPTVSSMLFREITEPDTPPPGYDAIYFDVADGSPKYVDDAGDVHTFGNGGSQPVVVKRIPITPATPGIFTELDLGYEAQEGDLVSAAASVTTIWDGDNPNLYVYLDGDAAGLPDSAIQQKASLIATDDQEGTGQAYQLRNWPLGSYIDRMGTTADLKAVVLVDTPGNPALGEAEIILLIFPIAAAL